jgi:hypothetical protein
MSQHITESRDLTPWDLWFLFSPFVRQGLHRFTNDFEDSDDGILCLQIFVKILEVQILNMRPQSITCFEDVLKAELRVTRQAADRVGYDA